MNDTKLNIPTKPPTPVEKALVKILKNFENFSHNPGILRKTIELDLQSLYTEADLIGYASGIRVGAIIHGENISV